VDHFESEWPPQSDAVTTVAWQNWGAKELHDAVNRISEGLSEILRYELNRIDAVLAERDHKIATLELELLRAQAEFARLHERVIRNEIAADSKAADLPRLSPKDLN
jgi:hypothetical protein